MHGPGRGPVGQHHGHHANHQKRRRILPDQVHIVDDADGHRNEEEAQIPQQEVGLLPHMVHLHDPRQQQDQQQKQTDDAGREGHRQNGLDALADPVNAEYQCNLQQDFHNAPPLRSQ